MFKVSYCAEAATTFVCVCMCVGTCGGFPTASCLLSPSVSILQIRQSTEETGGDAGMNFKNI